MGGKKGKSEGLNDTRSERLLIEKRVKVFLKEKR